MEPDVPVKVEMVWIEDVTSPRTVLCIFRRKSCLFRRQTSPIMKEHHEGAEIAKTEPTLEEVTWCVPKFEEDFTTQDTSQESYEEQLAVSCCAETNLKEVAALSVIEGSIPSDCSSSGDEDEDFSYDDDDYNDDDSDCYTPLPLGIIRSESSSCSDEGHFLSGNIKQPVCCECTAEKQPPMWGKCERPRQATVFCSVTGPAAYVRDIVEPTPYRLFKMFISDDIIDGIVMQTNFRAEEQYQNSGKSFISTTNKEIETFIGINILMSIKPQAYYRDYWSSAPDLHDSYISTLMTMNRFGWLLTHFQPNDTSNIPKQDLKIMEDPQFIKSEPETLPDTRESSKKEQPYSDDSKEPDLSFPHQRVEVKKENEIKAEPVTVPGNQHEEQEITREVKEEILNEETNSSSVDNSSLTTPGNIPVAGSILNCVAPFKITKKDGSHSCATCGKTFTRLEHVRRHSLTHVGEQSLSCSTCGKTFSRLDHMKRHELIHLDERPHLCTTCGKTFTEEVHLKTHSLVHLQGKKYSCSQCGGYFKHESSLKRHISTHFGNAPNTWGKAYTEKVYLKKNQVIQNKKEPHVCRTCGQMFMRLSHFTRHRLLHKSDGSRLDL